MTTVAAPPEREHLVEQPRKVVTFVSRRQNLRLVMKPRRPERSPVSGEVIGEVPGMSIQFDTFIDPVRRDQLRSAGVDEREAQAAARYGRFECPTEGEATLEYGQRLEDASALFQWLSRHRLNGDNVEGFWRVDPMAPPVSQAELDRLTGAAMDWDVETLAAIVAQERAGWGREDVIRIAEGSIERIQEREVELDKITAAEREARERVEKAAADKIAAAEKRAADAEARAARVEKK